LRLTDTEINIIKSSAKTFFDPGARIFLFGSRVDDFLKGGDIDLYVETDTAARLQDKISFITHLKLNLGDQKIDVVVNALNKKDQKIFHEARRTGIEL